MLTLLIVLATKFVVWNYLEKTFNQVWLEGTHLQPENQFFTLFIVNFKSNILQLEMVRRKIVEPNFTYSIRIVSASRSQETWPAWGKLKIITSNFMASNVGCLFMSCTSTSNNTVHPLLSNSLQCITKLPYLLINVSDIHHHKPNVPHITLININE